MSTQALEDTRSDAELISAVREGSLDAYGDLFDRHFMAAQRLARQLVSPGDADDLVSEAFMKVLGVLQRGGGPDVAFRAYLLTAVRRLRVDKLRATSKLQTSDDMELFDPGVPFRDTTIEGFENEAAARAFASLPERWQLVLWHTEVEEQKPAEIAPLLGMSANSVSALAYRAREGLRQAFLNEHVADIEGETCRWTHDHIGPYIRNGLSKRDVVKVDQHLEECRACAAIYLELVDVNSNLGAIIAPLLLGSAAVGYLATTSAASAVGFGAMVVGLFDRAQDFVVANAGVSAAGGVAAATAVAGLTFVAVADDPVKLPRETAAAIATTTDPSPVITSPSATTKGAQARRTPTATTAIEATTTPADPTTTPTSQSPAPAPDPTTDPTTKDPTPTPTSTPTPKPTSTPTPTPTPTPTATPTPTPAPTPPPTPTPTAAPLPDLAIGLSSTGRKGLVEELAVAVTGLPDGGSGTVTISAVNVKSLTTSDGRCHQQGADLVCTVTGSTPIAISAERIPNGDASVIVTVSGSTGDANPANNSASLVLDSK